MNKIAKLLVLTLVMVCILAFGASTALAAEYEHCAEALQAMGLFQGSESGFDLDRTPTRAEAAVMLVRLLGAEEAALSGEFSHPFTDVPQWASSYIAYMYDSGLTKGVSATTFNPQGNCDLQMFSTFVLRALEYNEAAGDFTYATAADFATQLGVADILTGSGEFMRDNLAAISYTALFAPTKNAETTLLAQLIEAGAVEAEAAQPYLSLYTDYAKIQAANAQLAKLGEQPVEMKLGMTMKMDMGAEGAMEMKLDSLLQMDAAAISGTIDLAAILADLNKAKFAMTNKITVSGSALGGEDQNITLDVYLLDGVCYFNTNMGELLGMADIPEHLQADLSAILAAADLQSLGLEQMMESMNDLTASFLPANPYAPYYGISQVKAIQSESLADGGTRFDLSYMNIPNELIQSMVDMIYGGMPEMMAVLNEVVIDTSIDGYSYTLDKDGNLKAQDMNVGVKQTMFPGTAEEITAQSQVQMSIEITKTGNDVKITLPGKAEDYADIVELINSMATPLQETDTVTTPETK